MGEGSKSTIGTCDSQAGRRYYVEAIMQQGGGGDNLAVRWQLPNGNFEEPLSATNSVGTRLVPFDGVEQFPGIYQQTTNLSVVEGRTAVMSVLVTNGAPVSYQWNLNSSPISGAVKPFYTVNNVSIAANNGQIYTCTVQNSSGGVASSPITLNVVPDSTALQSARFSISAPIPSKLFIPKLSKRLRRAIG